MKQHPRPTQNTNTSSSTPATSTTARARGGLPEGLPGRMITRQQLAAHVGLSVRMIDELTHTGVLPHFKIGKAVRYDLAEAEAAFRARYHVAAHPAQGRAGCPQPAASEDGGTVAATQRQEGLGCGVCPGSAESQGTPGGGLGTSLPTSICAAAQPAQGRAGCPQPAASEGMGVVGGMKRQEGLGCGVCPGSAESQGTPGGGLGTSLPTLNLPASGSPTSSGCVVASDNTINYHEKTAPAVSFSSISILNPAA